MNQISIIDIVIESFVRAVFNYRVAFKVAAVWLAIIALSFAVAGYLVWQPLGFRTDVAIVLSFLPLPLMIIGGCAIIVQWHRFILLEELPKSPLGAPVNRYVLRYFLVCLLFGLATIIPFMLISAVVYAVLGSVISLLNAVIAYALAAMLMYISVRFILIFPAAAVGRPDMTFRQSWEATRAQSWQMFLALVFLSIPFFIISLMLGYVAGWFGGATQVTLTLLNHLLNFVHSLVTVTFASLLFKKWLDDGKEAAAPDSITDGDGSPKPAT